MLQLLVVDGPREDRGLERASRDPARQEVLAAIGEAVGDQRGGAGRGRLGEQAAPAAAAAPPDLALPERGPVTDLPVADGGLGTQQLH